MSGNTENSVDKTKATSKRLSKRFNSLVEERKPFDGDYRKLAEQFLPHRGCFNSTDRKRIARLGRIPNNEALACVSEAGAGLCAGLCSQATPWFIANILGWKLDDNPGVKRWCETVTDVMRQMLSGGNFYGVATDIFMEFISFGIMSASGAETPDGNMRVVEHTVGEYYYSTDADGNVFEFYCEVEKTVGQLVNKFGLENVSLSTRNLYKQDNLDAGVNVVYVVEPNSEYVEGALGPRGKKISTWWCEKLSEWHIMRGEGFYEMPTAVAVWSPTSNSVYGYGPGHRAYGDAVSLQLLEQVSAKVASKLAEPPLVGPHELRNYLVNANPNAITYLPQNNTNGAKLEPLYRVDPSAITVLDNKIAKCEQRIKRAFYNDLFLMLKNSDRRQITATEIEALINEKQIIGSVVYRAYKFLTSLLERLFAIGLRNGRFPEPPPEIQGQQLNIEFTSPLAQALKRSGFTNIYTFIDTVKAIAEIKPEVIDRIDEKELVQHTADKLGVSPQFLLDDETVNGVRTQRAQREQAMVNAQLLKGAKDGADAANALNGIDPNLAKGAAQAMMGGKI